MNQFTLSASPHLKRPESVTTVMFLVILALLPSLIWGFYLFGLTAIWITLACVLSCVVGEAFVLKLRKRSLAPLKDCSAILTGILLAMVLPPSLPLPYAILGSLFAIIIGKGVFGGLGFNIFNPALLGRAFLQISFPVMMTTWVINGVATATPLALGKFDHQFTDIITLLLGQHGGCIGETSALLLLLGGLFLVYKKIIDARIPLAIFGTIAVMAILFDVFIGNTGSILYHWFSGGVVIGAFFMATDWVTSPITRNGSVVYGIGIGVVIMTIRVLGGLPEGVMFSILFMNAFVPLINRHTYHRKFGHPKRLQKKEG